MSNKEFRTTWSKEAPAYGAFDEYIIFESLESHSRFLIRPEEFDFLMRQMFDKWKEGKMPYTQVLKEWNESVGFNDVEGLPGIVRNVQELIGALELIQGTDTMAFATMMNSDIRELTKFMITYHKENFQIKRE